jgi:hypothetical protein
MRQKFVIKFARLSYMNSVHYFGMNEEELKDV